MYFLIEDDELVKKNNDIWNKVSNIIKKEFDSKPIYNKKIWKTKIKCYGGFCDKNMPKVGFNYICLAVTLIDFVLIKDEDFYSRKFLKECKYIEKEKKAIRCISYDEEILYFFMFNVHI